MKLFRSVLLLSGLVVLAACSSRPLIPESSSVKVSREEPSANCENLGRLQGSVMSQKPKPNEALEDLKKEASRKGANYVKLETYSGYETAVSGTAYNCP